MVLTPEYWINHSKKSIKPEYEEKIITDDIYLIIRKKTDSYHSILDCKYKGDSFNDFYSKVIMLINQKIAQLHISPARGLEWIVRDKDTPTDLKLYLENKGFSRFFSLYMMGIDLISFTGNLDIKNEKFVTKMASKEEMLDNRLLELTLKYFPGYHKSVADLKKNRQESFEKEEKLQITSLYFITYKLDSMKPVAYASMMINQDLPGIGIFTGALTDEEYRKQGIYTTLVNKRIKYARDNGLRYLVVDADPNTSAPILATRGFTIFDKYDAFRLSFS